MATRSVLTTISPPFPLQPRHTHNADRLGLVRVEAAHPASGQSCDNPRVQPGGDGNDVGGPCGDNGVMPDAARERRLRQDHLQDPLDLGRFVVTQAADLKPNVRAKLRSIVAASTSVCRG